MEIIQTYQYKPLTKPSEIRILHLLSKPGQNLYCKIKHIQLHEPESRTLRISNFIQPFIALSYEWGDVTFPFRHGWKAIVLDDRVRRNDIA